MLEDTLSINNSDNLSCFSNSRVGDSRVSTDVKFGASKLGAKLREGPNLELDASSADVLASSIARFLTDVLLMNHGSVGAVLLVG